MSNSCAIDFSCEDFESFSIELPPNIEEEKQRQEIDAELTKNCDIDIPASTIVTILTTDNPDLLDGHTPIQLQNILQSNFYLHTNPPVVRSLHELPTLRPRLYCPDFWAFSADPFFNQTHEMFFTKCSPHIESYLNLSEDFLATIDTDEFTAVTIPKVLSIFGNIALEERRIGIMLSSWKEYCNVIFSAALPAYYLEHNFFLSQKNQESIENQFLFSGNTGIVLPGLNFDTFVNQHLVSDKAGIGDLRLQALYDLSRERRELYVGGQITFPTAHAFINGIIGNKFCKTKQPPFIRLSKNV